MKTTFMRTLLATVATALMASWAAAQWQQSAYMGEMGGGEEMPGAYPESYGGECYGGECYGGDCGSGQCYGGGDYGCCECGDYACGDCQCGGNPCGCDPSTSCCDNYDQNCGMFYAEIQNLALRPNVPSSALGKLSEKYEWSPRAVMGYETPSGVGARTRYWRYGRTTANLDGNEPLDLDFEVVDAEGTARFRTTHADLIIAGGFRWANIEIEQDGDLMHSDMPGLTVAADLRGAFCRGCSTEWAGVAGARWSLLRGDWEGEGNDLLDDEVFDDNMVVHELYGGVEFVKRGCHCDCYVRAVFEIQNWHSDALDENDASIGFIGPALHGGFTF